MTEMNLEKTRPVEGGGAPSGNARPTAQTGSRKRGNAKVKTGCLTCRKRKVKCDEDRPACRRCVSTGRPCDGYGIWGGGGNAYGSEERALSSLSVMRRPRPSGAAPVPAGAGVQWILSVSPATLPGLGGQAEAAAFDYFRRYTSMKMPGLFESYFWESLVLQTSTHEPAILHAVTAMGAAHRNDERLSLQQYNKAISFLRPHLESRAKDAFRVALITCMVFVSLELLRGNFEISNNHLRNGLILLREFQAREGLTPTDGPVVLRPDPSVLDDHVIEAFTRLNIQSALFGQGSSFVIYVGDATQEPLTYTISSRFDTLREARQRLDGLLNGVYTLESEARKLADQQKPVPDGLFRRRLHLQEALAEWLPAFDLGSAAMEARATFRTALAVPLLRLYHTMTKIMAGTCLRGTDEAVYDNYAADFEVILNYAVELFNRATTDLIVPAFAHGEHIPESHFTVDMGFIPPLYYVGLKSRSANIRRRALEILFQAPHREGFWDGVFAARLVREIIQMEEGERYDDDPIELVWKPGTLHVPSPPRSKASDVYALAHARVNEVTVALPSEVGRKAVLTCKRFRIAEGAWETITRRLDLEFDAPRPHPWRTCAQNLYV